MLVFISYSHQDSDFAQLLNAELQSWGFGTWIDVQNIRKGEYWPDAIDTGLENADVVAGVLSDHSMQSNNVKNEWDWAIEYEKPIFLLRLRPTKISHRYIRINYIDFVSGVETGLKQFYQALKQVGTAAVKQTRPQITVMPPVTVPSTAGVPQPPPAAPATSTRHHLIHRVREAWIDGVLRQNMLSSRSLQLAGEARPEAVIQPGIVLQHPQLPTYELPSSQQIVDVFNDLGRELLILGRPGAGKTMTLLQLADVLLERAAQDATSSIPVVFNLASWSQCQLPLDQWLVERLQTEYRLKQKTAAQLVQDQNILPLLDGLDEVQRQQRSDCVDAINAFWRSYAVVDRGIVVCSRINDYDMLSARLDFASAFTLQPLTPERIDQYLTQLGSEWDALRRVLHANPRMMELASTPLLLNFMAVAYRGLGEAQIAAHKSDDDLTQHFFEYYITRHLRADGEQHAYAQQDTRRYLGWLAQNMVRTSQTVFHPSAIQPDWLLAAPEKRAYARWFDAFALASRALLGAIGGGLAWTTFYVTTYLMPPSTDAHLFGSFAHDELMGVLPIAVIIGGLLSTFSKFRLGKRLRFVGESLQRLPLGVHVLLAGVSWALIQVIIFGIVFAVAVSLASIGLGVGLITLSLLFLTALVLTSTQAYVIEPTLQRVVLWRTLRHYQRVPRNLAAFLDYANRKQLLRRTGESYIFRHRMLMDYFAEVKDGD